MANVCAFNRKENENTWCRYFVVCRDGLDEEFMSQLNKQHEQDKANYSFSYYDHHDLAFLGGYIPPFDTWELLIVQHTTERHHRMEFEPDWIIRNEAGYYYDHYSKVVYAGPNIYAEDYVDEQYATSNN